VLLDQRLPEGQREAVASRVTLVLAAGVLIGFVGAAIASRVLQSMLFGVTRLDAVTYTAVVFSLSAAALVAALLPALRAARSEPLAVLRSDG
jgi:putative ABC transport system permease protein